MEVPSGLARPSHRSRSPPSFKRDDTVHGIKEVEVYGFVGWVSSWIGFVVFLLWAFLPDSVLLSLGVSYYPSKYWALALPAYLVVMGLFVLTAYTALNLIHTPPLDSFNTIRDSHTRPPEFREVNSFQDERAIPAVHDIPMQITNRLLFDHRAHPTGSGVFAVRSRPFRSVEN